jgi:hypothetical protein
VTLLSVAFTTRLQFGGHRQDLLQTDAALGLPKILPPRWGLGVPDLHQHGPAGAWVSLVWACGHAPTF